MKLTILGAHQGETANTGFTSILIDDAIAIDAGHLASPLSLGEQFNLRHLLVTHQHFDHIKDLGSLGFLMMFHKSLNVYCTDGVRDVIRNTILHRDIWLDYFSWPSPENPAYRHFSVEPLRSFDIEGYEVKPIPSNHIVPTCGYQITDPAGTSVYYTADNGPGCHRDWLNADSDVLITEVTYGNSEAELAKLVTHLCPSQLQGELEQLRAHRGRLPQVMVLHVNPHHINAIEREIAEVEQAIDHPIRVTSHHQIVDLAPA